MSKMSFSATYTSYNVFPRFSVDDSNSKARDLDGKLFGDLITFLAILDLHHIDIAWLSWDDAMGTLGRGGTSHISQSTLTTRTSLAFKRFTSVTNGTTADVSEEYKLATAEVLALSHNPTRYHPNLMTLEGISWEFSERTKHYLPVLLFEKAVHGDLLDFVSSPFTDPLDLSARFCLCRHIAVGLVALHRFGIIHGDINPRNILVFDDNGKPLPKLSDFGYGALMAKGDAIRLATTWPWNAPETDFTWSFDFSSAQKTDIYSLGLVCLWVIFWPMVESLDPNEGVAMPNEWVEELRKKNSLRQEAMNMIDLIPFVDPKQRHRLRLFFQHALADIPEDRSVHLQGLFDHDEADLDYQPLPDYRLWKDIFEALRRHAESNTDRASEQNAAFQLSICYKLGFGCEQSDTESTATLSKSGFTDEDFRDEISRIQETKQLGPPPKGLLRVLGRKIEAIRYLRDNVLDEAFVAHETMIFTLEQLLVNTDVRIILQKLILSEILHQKKNYERSEDVALNALEDSTPLTGKFLALSTLRNFYYETGRWSKMLEYATQLFELQKKTRQSREVDQVYGDLDMLHELKHLENMFAFLHYEKRFAQALDIACRCSELGTAVYGPGSAGALQCDANLALVYSNLHQTTKSEEIFERAIKTGEKNFSAKSEVVLYIKQLQLSAYKKRADAKMDRDRGAKILEDCRGALPPDHFTTKAMIKTMAHIYAREGYMNEALLLAEEYHRLCVIGPSTWAAADAMSQLANLYWGLIRWDEAEHLLVQGVGLLGAIVQDDNPKLLFMQRRLAIWRRWRRVWRCLEYVLPEYFIMLTARGYSAFTRHIWGFLYRHFV